MPSLRLPSPLRLLSSPTSLRSNVVWTLGGQLTFLLTQFAILATLARAGGADTLGTYALAVSICTPIFTFASLHLRVVQSTDLQNRFPLSTCLRLRTVTTAASMLVIAVWSRAFGPTEALVIMLLAIARSADTLADAYHGEFQKRQRLDFVARSTMVRSATTAAAFLVTFFATRSLVAAVAIQPVVSTTVLLAVDRRRSRSLENESEAAAIRLGFAALAPLVLFALPAGFVNSANAWIVALPRLVLQNFHGNEALGLFAAVTYLIVAAGTAVLAVNQSSLARLARYARSDDRSGDATAFRLLLRRLLLLNSAAGVGCLLLSLIGGRFVLSTLFGYDDPALVGPFRIAMLATAVRFTMRPFIVALRAFQQLRPLAAVSAGSLASVAAASLMLIPSSGLIGAALALAIGAAVECAGLAIAFRRCVVPRLADLAAPAVVVPSPLTAPPRTNSPRTNPSSPIPAAPMTNPRPTCARPIDFCIVGAPKCGTTSLFHYLRDRADVFIPHVKEPHFFCTDFPDYCRLRSLRDYEALFRRAKPDQLIGEASVHYLMSAEAVPNLLRHSPDCKLIVMVRRPADMLHSYHAQIVNGQRETMTDFADAWAAQADRAAGRDLPPHCLEPSHLQYREVASFGRQLQRVYEAAARENVLVLFQDELKANPRMAYLRVLDFLGLDDDGREDFSSFNASKVHRWPRVSKFLMRPPAPLSHLKEGLKTLLKIRGSVLRPLYFGLLYRNQRRAPMPAELDREIMSSLSDDIRLLSDLTGRDLSHWLADKPAAAVRHAA